MGSKKFIITVLLIIFVAGLCFSQVPTKPTIRIEKDSFGKLEFKVLWNVYFGTPAESWELYEDDGTGYVLVAGPIALENPGIPQYAEHMIYDKKYGVYKYKAKLINASGETWSDEAAVVMGGASDISISPDIVDTGRQVYQMTQDLGTRTYQLSCLDVTNPDYTVLTNNTHVVNPSVNGSTLTINALNSGRAGLKIIENTSGKIRHVGVRVKDSNGQLPGMPSYLGIGSVGTNVDRDLNYCKDFQEGDKNKRMDVRYVYLNGEPDSWDSKLSGWQVWGKNIKGDRAITYISENMKLGIIPFFVYYTICGGNESYQTDLKNIQDVAYLSRYFKDLNFALEIIEQEAEGDLVGMIFEPDFIGYMMQNSGKKAFEIYANTKLVYETAYGGENAAGILDSKVDVDPDTGVPFEDTITGLVRAVNYLVTKYNTTKGTNIVFGWQFNTWSNAYPGVPVKGLMHKTDTGDLAEGRKFIEDRAYETAIYYMEAGITSFGASIVSIDKYGKDACAYETTAAADPANSTWFWGADNWNNYLGYISVLNKTTGLPVVLWQLPVGHIERSQSPDPYSGGLFNELTNTKNGAECFYEDSSVTYFFGDTFKPGTQKRFDWFSGNKFNDPLITTQGTDTITWGSHFELAKDSGVCLALFGAGVGEATHGNVSDVSTATEPEDDSWFFVNTQRYLANPVYLDIQTPTPTPTPTATPVLKNIAVGKFINASSSFAPEFNYKNANDGNEATIWGSEATGKAQWIYIDLGKVTKVNGVILKWFDKYYPTYYQIAISIDGVKWSFVANMPKNKPGTDSLMGEGSVRYIGIYCTKFNAGAAALSEYEILSYVYQ